jgi:hypothetical protein
MRFQLDATPTPATSASGVEVDGETVLLDRTTGALHQLNYAGAAIWSRLDGSRTVGAIVEELSEAFGAEPQSVAHDVEQFLSHLAARGLLEGSASPEPQTPDALPESESTSVDTLWVDWYTAQVVEALRGRGIEAILLKGPAIRDLLYRDLPGARGYVDADLLVEERNLAAAAAVLTELGFRRADERGMDALTLYATTWHRARDGAEIDLHRTLHGCEHSTVDPWPILRADAVEQEVGGTGMLVPSIPARVLQLVLVSPADRPWRRWDDLARAFEQLSPEAWLQARAVATALGVERLFAYRLSQSAAGAALAARLGMPGAPSWWLRWEADPVLRWVVLLASLPGWRLRLRLARHLLLPGSAYVRFRDPEAASRGLLGAYLAWATHALRLMPGAFVSLVRSLVRRRGAE